MMPVLHQPAYIPQPVSWEDPKWQGGALQEKGIGSKENQKSRSNLPINEMALDFDQLREELEKVRKESYEVGYRDGLEAGREEGYHQGLVEAERNFREQQWRQQQHFQQLLSNMMEAIQNELKAFFSRAEEAVTELALEIAKKVVDGEVKTNTEIVKRAVSQALDQLKGGNITVRLNPEDFLLLGDDLSLVNLDRGFSVNFVPDEKVERGGVIAESEQGVVDLQPSTKFSLLQVEVL